MYLEEWTHWLGMADGDFARVLRIGVWIGLILGVFVWLWSFWAGSDEPESLILAQSERWRHA